MQWKTLIVFGLDVQKCQNTCISHCSSAVDWEAEIETVTESINDSADSYFYMCFNEGVHFEL